MESNGEVKAIMDSRLCSTADEDSSNTGLVRQIANERLAAVPITNPKQIEFCRRMSSISGDLGLRCDSIPSLKKSLKINLQPRIEKEIRRLSKLDVLVIDIGSWKRITQFKGHVVAKFFFHTRKMMWEILENGVKNKIEIKWDDIINIKVDIVTFGFCMLQVELSSSQVPLFYEEIDPKSRKHVCNKISSDFTCGEAMRTRFHTLWFLEADLDKPYERLLHYEPKFATLNQTALSKPEWPYTASKKMLDQNIQPIYSSYFQETLPKPGHDQTLTHRALVEPFQQRLHVELQSDQMIPSYDLSQEELSDLINLDYAGNDTYAEDNGSEAQNIPYYQHPLAGAEQNHENRTMGNQIFDPFESASSLPLLPPPPPPSSPPPPPVQYQSATTNNNGPREASNAALSIHQEMGNSAEATIQPEPVEGMSIVKRLCIDLAAIQEQNQNMASESLIHNPNFMPHNSFEHLATDDDGDITKAKM